VPPFAVKEGQVVLNLAMRAVENLELGNEVLRFRARFSGHSHEIVVPVAAVRAIYAQENGQGMMFPAEPAAAEPGAEPPGEPTGPKPGPSPAKGPKLRIVK
jgi:stringent starvation protein B